MSKESGTDEKFKELSEGSLEHLREYLENRGTPNLKTAGDFSLLHEAVIANEIVKVKLLIQHGCDVDAATVEGCRPVDIAVLYKHNSVLEILLEAEADASNTAALICTLLQYAVMADNTVAVKLLLTKGRNCSPNVIKGNEIYHFPLAQAVLKNNKEMCELLLENGALVGILGGYFVFDYMCEDIEFLKLFLQYDSDQDHLQFLLQKCVFSSRKFDVVEFIVEKLNPFRQTVFFRWLIFDEIFNGFIKDERPLKPFVSRYGLATKFSPENILLQWSLSCSQKHFNVRSRKRKKILSVLVRHGLMLYPTTMYKTCKFGRTFNLCKDCFDTASYLYRLRGVPSLKAQCCSVIRQTLPRKGWMLDFKTVQSLSLPAELIDYICMKEW